MYISDNRFKEGQKVASIFWADDGFYEAGNQGCKRITVIMENGQMAGVPWFLVEYDDSSPRKFNGAMLEGVTLLPELLPEITSLTKE